MKVSCKNGRKKKGRRKLRLFVCGAPGGPVFKETNVKISNAGGLVFGSTAAIINRGMIPEPGTFMRRTALGTGFYRLEFDFSGAQAQNQ